MALLRKDTPLVYISGINVHIGLVALGQDDTSEMSLFSPVYHAFIHIREWYGSLQTGFFSD